MENITVKLEKKEVLFLASILGGDEFLGIENIMFSLSQDEIRNEWINVQNSLEEREFIEVNFDGSILIDELINAMISTCIYKTLYINQKICDQNKTAREIHYYITEYLTVKMEELDITTLSFSLLFTVNDVEQEIINNISMDNLPKSKLKDITIPEDLLEEAKSYINQLDNDNAHKVLVDSGIDRNFSIELLELMNQPIKYNSMIMIEFPEDKNGQVSEMIFLQSANHLWRCKINIIDTKTIYEFIPQNYQEILLNIESILKPIGNIYIHGNQELAG